MARTSASTLGRVVIDLLEVLRQRVPLSREDVATATGTDAQTMTAWLERQALPVGEQAARLIELIAAVERLEVSTKPEAIASGCTATCRPSITRRRWRRFAGARTSASSASPRTWSTRHSPGQGGLRSRAAPTTGSDERHRKPPPAGRSAGPRDAPGRQESTVGSARCTSITFRLSAS
jgi:hypothetical protein